MRTRTASILAIVALAVPAFPQAPAQAPSTTAGVVRLNKVPISTQPLKLKLPRPVEKTLSNGAKLVVLESHRIPSISFQMSFPSGNQRDGDIPGLSDATAFLIMQGTKTKDSKQISEAIAELGASIGFSAGPQSGSFFVSALTENFDAALALASDILLNATFPQEELDKWKVRQQASLEQAKSSPGSLGNDLMMRTLYPSDFRRSMHPTLASLSAITREKILEHYKKYYVPSGEWAGIAGDITPAQAVSKLDKAFGAWKGGPVDKPIVGIPTPLAEKQVYFVPRPNSVQTLLIIANNAIDRTSPDYIPIQVMNRVLGNGPSSRLFRIIREEKGYTYGISSGFSATRVLNYFSSSTSVRTEVTEAALTDVLKEFQRIRDVAVPADELTDAKNAINGSFALNLQSTSSILGRWMEQREYNLPEDYWDTYAQKISAVTAEDVMRVAKKYVPLTNAQIIAVGDPKILDTLKKFGPVEQVPPDKI